MAIAEVHVLDTLNLMTEDPFYACACPISTFFLRYKGNNGASSKNLNALPYTSVVGIISADMILGGKSI